MTDARTTGGLAARAYNTGVLHEMQTLRATDASSVTQVVGTAPGDSTRLTLRRLWPASLVIPIHAAAARIPRLSPLRKSQA
jgi:hypothetical protein